IDVFVYDKLPVNQKLRKRYKFWAKKLARLLSTKYSAVKIGHYYGFYKALATFIPKTYLERQLNKLIEKANNLESPYWGRGYQCVGKNCLEINDIYPLKRMSFEGQEFNTINRPEMILIQQYGNDYLIEPPLDKQVIRHCKELIPELCEAERVF
ncbi:MAG: LicD family protein, partial [Proteobacteria bacterium]|nr:LicD family protein [Pseudomonadota bacterium]